MARQQRQQTPTGRGRRRGLTDRGRPRKYTRINVDQIDYKDLTLLRRFISDRGKTRSRRVTGLSRKHQQQLALAVKRARAAEAEKQAAERAGETSALLGKTVLTINHRAGEDGKLFGSVTSAEIAEAIQAARGIKVDRKKIRLDEPIRETGTFMVEVEVGGGTV